MFHSRSLTDLNELNLEHNELSFVSPKHFADLQNLHILHLGHNQFTKFESGLFTSNPIKHLNLDGNYIKTLPNDFLAGNISISLKVIILKGNMLKEVPQCVFEKNEFQTFLPKLTILDLSKNNITELSVDLFHSTSSSVLKIIDLSFNKLKTLQKDIFYSSALSRLKFLYVSHNRITYLQEKLFYSPYLKNIEIIDFSHNKIQDVPEKLFHSPYLQKLCVLDLSFNQINFIPSKFLKNQALKRLIRISLNNNNLTSVPDDMLPVTVPQLCDFNLANNKISSIGELLPVALKNMKRQRHSIFYLNDYWNICKLDLSNNS